MKASIAPAQTDQHERILKAAVTAVYDRYCSGSIAELESAVVALIGVPIPDEAEGNVDLDNNRSDLHTVDHLIHFGLPEEQGRATERLAIMTTAPAPQVPGADALTDEDVDRLTKDILSGASSNTP